MSKAEELLHKLTDGRRCNGVCLLSKKQSEWFRNVLIKEQGYALPATVGGFSVRAMGRAFSRNGNGSVIHVLHTNEAQMASDWDFAHQEDKMRDVFAERGFEWNG